MIDKLIIKDIHLTASNDDQYFVFEDVLYQVMLCFSRDSEIMNLIPSQAYMQVTLKGKQIRDTTMVFPPSGIIPFHGFTMYGMYGNHYCLNEIYLIIFLAAPICYLFPDAVSLYNVFRAFYIRYWHRLHRVCVHSQGIVSLCLLFEQLLQCYDPMLWFHFKEIDIPP